MVNRFIGGARTNWYRFLGMKVGKETYLPRIFTTFPNQVKIGEKCHLEQHIYFKAAGIWQPQKKIFIGDNSFVGQGCEFNISESIAVGKRCLIASGCKFIDHNHGIEGRLTIRGQKAVSEKIILENDVWLGCNVVILKGVIIGEGVVVAAGAVVNKSIPPFEIWAGVPAKKIGERK